MPRCSFCHFWFESAFFFLLASFPWFLPFASFLFWLIAVWPFEKRFEPYKEKILRRVCVGETDIASCTGGVDRGKEFFIFVSASLFFSGWFLHFLSVQTEPHLRLFCSFFCFFTSAGGIDSHLQRPFAVRLDRRVRVRRFIFVFVSLLSLLFWSENDGNGEILSVEETGKRHENKVTVGCLCFLSGYVVFW